MTRQISQKIVEEVAISFNKSVQEVRDIAKKNNLSEQQLSTALLVNESLQDPECSEARRIREERRLNQPSAQI